ncbi:hypothetical protein Celly_1717 [Cellulophaga lytica DSM 7489]|uniref:Uncharacterized protein n=1 Tax=Cellulophaga lytica (strain ATCC 23178 / DSM 7489 / JCM 8516 / NBRC 14961 / NCIMB 1423 / VKM B-1433 / Cy l20) TaxID=867900 RepID=F0RBB9_CELLC|nr:hypothetical protein Celly_1717 [Cellulophaga lytica DSM 7489]
MSTKKLISLNKNYYSTLVMTSNYLNKYFNLNIGTFFDVLKRDDKTSF